MKRLILLLFSLPLALMAETLELSFVWDNQRDWDYLPLLRIGTDSSLVGIDEIPGRILLSREERNTELEKTIILELELQSQDFLEIYLTKSNGRSPGTDWMELDWYDFVQVGLSWSQGQIRITPGYGFGGLWHLGNFFPQEGKFFLMDNIFPAREVVTVTVFDAVSGLGLTESNLELMDANDRLITSYRPNEEGVLVFFPDPSVVSYRLTRDKYLPISGSFPPGIGERPMRIPLPMTRPLEEEEHRLIYTWGPFPPDLDGTLVMNLENELELPPIKVELNPKERRFFRNQAIFDRDGTQGWDSEVLTLKTDGILSYVLDFDSLEEEESGFFSNLTIWHYQGQELLYEKTVDSMESTEIVTWVRD